MSFTTQRTRFEGLAHLYPHGATEVLARARVCILGLGGVGSWAAEALARSGVGHLTLVDLDEACVSNINRQVHALTSTIGQSKTALMVDRIKDINPECQAEAIADFISGTNAPQILDGGFDFVLDAIDGIAAKCHVLSYCYHQGIPVIASGGAGSITNPYGIKIADLSSTSHDRLLLQLRRKLRSRFGFPKASKAPWGLPVVYNPRLQPIDRKGCALPTEGQEIENQEQLEVAPGGGLDCAGALGSACFVTGSMGFFAASYIVNALLGPGKKV